ncbi:MAG: translation initiation factor IF-2 subunit beta [Euryarchaeota archaeon RBG_13_61_15]|jgi:translation initiation factor 2 subunit 2|nr:MAG: translation initiation factor IF-2 subunit beta [Euryarchaeota archaeon RBG_13_61_15]
MAPEDVFDYEVLLERAKKQLPQKLESHDRFQVPEPDVMIEGKTTVIRNFGEIAGTLRREPDHILGFLLRELGTAGTLEGQRVVFKGKVATAQIADRIRNYVDEYVLCSECNRPDTKIVKDGRVLILTCETCGAHRPVHVRKQPKAVEAKEIVQGETYDLMIEDMGKRGDGIARKGPFIIYVPGTAKGSQVKVKIEKVSGTVAFGVLFRE